MSMLYQNERQVLSIIHQCRKEAQDANPHASVTDRQADVVARVADGFVQTMRRLVHGTRQHARRAAVPALKH